MSKYSSLWYKGWSGFTSFVSSIEWTSIKGRFNDRKRGWNLTEEDWLLLQTMLASDYYIILTRRKTHLTTYTIMAMTWLKTGKFPQYSHALMNLDCEANPENFMKFKLMEATSKGVHYSKFDEVFDCDYVCLLEPLNVDRTEWASVIEGLAKQMGKPYDNLFDVKDNSHVSCVEMVLDSLRENPNYMVDFANLEQMVQSVGNLTPQMLRDCPDFRVVLEIKR